MKAEAQTLRVPLQLKGFSSFILVLVFPALFSGCASDPEWSEAAKRQQTSTGVRVGPDAGIPEKPSVEYIRVRMTDTVFLDPPEASEPGIFLRVRNTSDREALDLHGAVASRLQAKGYRLVNNAKDAVYVMQANILFADEVSAAELAKLDEITLGTDVASILTGAAVGGAVGAVGGGVLGGGKGAAIGGAAGAVLGGLTSGLADSARKERLKAKQLIKFYSLVVDIQLRERSKGSVQIAGSSGLSAERPSGGGAFSEHSAYSRQETQSYSETSKWKRYQTRIVGKAKGKLTVFDDVEQDFIKRLAGSIAGLF